MVTMASPPSKSASGVIPFSRPDALFLFNDFITLTVTSREGESILIGRSISAGEGEAVAMSCFWRCFTSSCCKDWLSCELSSLSLLLDVCDLR